MYTDQEIEAVIGTATTNAFGDYPMADKVMWVKFVMGVDGNPKSHKAEHYIYLARSMAEGFESIYPQDYGDESALEQMKTLVVALQRPYKDDAEEQAPWRAWKVTPVQVSLATRVVKAAMKKTSAQPMLQGAVLSQDTSPFTKAMEEYVQVQKAALEKEHKKGVLSYDVSERRKEVGLADLAEKAIPTEESLVKLEDKSKGATEKGRLWVGSSEGEDLQISFPPRWAKTPTLNVMAPGNESFEDKMKTVWNANRARSMAERADFRSFANFQAHVMSWGYKMIFTKVFTPVDLLSYMHILVNIADDCGGSKTACYYDLICRQEMAEALEHKDNDLRPFLVKIDQERLKQAQNKTDQKLQEMGRDAARSGGNKKGGVSYWQGAKKPYKGGNVANGKGMKGGNDHKGANGKGYNPNRDEANRARVNRSRSPRRQQQLGNGKPNSKGKQAQNIGRKY